MLVRGTWLQNSLHWVLIPGIAICITLWPSLISGLERLQTDPGDTLFNLYLLENNLRHFTSETLFNPDRYWSPDYFWPIRNTLAWSDHLLGQSVLYGPIRSLFDPYQSYLIWLASTLWLNYISIRLACRRISGDTNPTWLSITALVTCLSPTITQQLGHPQLLSLFLIGPLLWQCHRLINDYPEQFSISDWLICCSWLLGNSFFNIYTFVYGCYGVTVCAGVHLLRRLHEGRFIIRRGKSLFKAAIVFASSIGLSLSIYIPYLKTLQTFGARPGDEILANLPKPMSWLFGSSQWLLTPPLTPDWVEPNWISGKEQELFPGWFLLILLCATILTAFWKKSQKDHSLDRWLIILAIMIILSLSINQFSFWPLISKFLPGAGSLRASSRIGMIIVLFASPSISLAARDWHPKLQRSRHLLAGLLAVTGGFVSIFAIRPSSFSLKQWEQEHQALNKAIVSKKCDLFWYEWSDQEPWRAHILAMHSQLDTGVATVNGYSGHFPKEQWPFTQPNGESAMQWVTHANQNRFHEIKPNKEGARRCIANGLNEQNIPKIAIRIYDPSQTAHQNISWIKRPNAIVFKHGNSAVGRKFGMLYLKTVHSSPPHQWLLITRSGAGVPAARGDFQITDINLKTNGIECLAFITDKNKMEGVEYIWKINAKTGEFLSQQFKSFKAK